LFVVTGAPSREESTWFIQKEFFLIVSVNMEDQSSHLSDMIGIDDYDATIQGLVPPPPPLSKESHTTTVQTSSSSSSATTTNTGGHYTHDSYNNNNDEEFTTVSMSPDERNTFFPSRRTSLQQQQQRYSSDDHFSHPVTTTTTSATSRPSRERVLHRLCEALLRRSLTKVRSTLNQYFQETHYPFTNLVILTVSHSIFSSFYKKSWIYHNVA
jgi:hypothetical protein